MEISERQWCFFVCVLLASLALGLAKEHRPTFNDKEFLQQIFSEATDSESLLASGGKLCFATADEFDLALIAGISNVMARRLYTEKEAVLEKSLPLAAREKQLALTMIDGIGEKKAKQFGSHLCFERKASLTTRPQYTTFQR